MSPVQEFIFEKLKQVPNLSPKYAKQFGERFISFAFIHLMALGFVHFAAILSSRALVYTNPATGLSIT